MGVPGAAIQRLSKTACWGAKKTAAPTAVNGLPRLTLEAAVESVDQRPLPGRHHLGKCRVVEGGGRPGLEQRKGEKHGGVGGHSGGAAVARQALRAGQARPGHASGSMFRRFPGKASCPVDCTCVPRHVKAQGHAVTIAAVEAAAAGMQGRSKRVPAGPADPCQLPHLHQQDGVRNADADRELQTGAPSTPACKHQPAEPPALLALQAQLLRPTRPYQLISKVSSWRAEHSALCFSTARRHSPA